jgi:hypothetical protein
MTADRDVHESASAISREIGLDLSYFAEPGEKNLLHIPVALGLLLLHWFLEGIVTGVGEGIGEGLDRGVANSIRRLGKRVRRLFSRDDRSEAAEAALDAELTAEATAAVENARGALTGAQAEEAAKAANAYEVGLVGYLTDRGMPARDAMRIAQRVRAEAGIQLEPVIASL